MFRLNFCQEDKIILLTYISIHLMFRLNNYSSFWDLFYCYISIHLMFRLNSHKRKNPERNFYNFNTSNVSVEYLQGVKIEDVKEISIHLMFRLNQGDFDIIAFRCEISIHLMFRLN